MFCANFCSVTGVKNLFLDKLTTKKSVYFLEELTNLHAKKVQEGGNPPSVHQTGGGLRLPFAPLYHNPPFTHLVMEASVLQSISLEVFPFSRGSKKITRKSKCWQRRRRRHHDYTAAVFLCISTASSRVRTQKGECDCAAADAAAAAAATEAEACAWAGRSIARGAPRRWQHNGGSFRG